MKEGEAQKLGNRPKSSGRELCGTVEMTGEKYANQTAKSLHVVLRSPEGNRVTRRGAHETSN